MKIFLDTIGCRLNQAEIESLANQFRLAGHEIISKAGDADLAVINTCTVTGQAESDSRTAIRRANRLGAGRIVVTGCWATLDPVGAASLQGVCKIVPNLNKDILAAELLELPSEYFNMKPLRRMPLPGQHGRTRAFIKVQDGCDNACSFCITTIARGASRSRSVEDILRDVKTALDGGAKEIVLTGVHLGAWGRELSPERHLTDLISSLLVRSSIPRMRLSSIEPWDLEPDFFSLWEDSCLCRHLHMPVQSGNADVLRRMRRKVTPDSYAVLVESARAIIPEVAITTDIITGFPGETEKEFSETLEFIKTIGFAGGHVFTYSARPGTPAAQMKNQVKFEVRKERNASLRSVFTDVAAAYRRNFLGQTVTVLWEASHHFTGSGWILKGLTDTYLRVTAVAPQPIWNQLTPVEITSLTKNGLQGKICKMS